MAIVLIVALGTGPVIEMDEETSAAWAQAVLSAVAILASGGFAVWVPARERRLKELAEDDARLRIETRRLDEHLKLRLIYDPAERHVGLLALVRVLGPAGVLIQRGDRTRQVGRGFEVWMADTLDKDKAPDKVAMLPFRSTRHDEDGLFHAVGFPIGADGARPDRARIKVTIAPNTGGPTLYSREMIVSAID